MPSVSERPVFSIFHGKSSAVEVMKECKADKYTVSYNEKADKTELNSHIENTFLSFVVQNKIWNPDLKVLDKYSAKESAKKLVSSIETVLV